MTRALILVLLLVSYAACTWASFVTLGAWLGFRSGLSCWLAISLAHLIVLADSDSY